MRDYFRDTDYRDLLAKFFRESSLFLNDKDKPEDLVEEINSLLNSFFEENKKINLETFEKYFSASEVTCLIGLITLAELATYFLKERPITKTWSRDETLCPNFIIYTVLTHIYHHLYSAVLVLKNGLDVPARTLLRSAYDGLWTFILIINSKDTFHAYQAVTQDEFLDKNREKKVWKDYFSLNNLLRELEKIDKTIFDEETSGKNLLERKKTYGFLSSTAHSSYNTNLALAIRSESILPTLDPKDSHFAGNALFHIMHIFDELFMYLPKLIEINHGGSIIETLKQEGIHDLLKIYLFLNIERQIGRIIKSE